MDRNLGYVTTKLTELIRILEDFEQEFGNCNLKYPIGVFINNEDKIVLRREK